MAESPSSRRSLAGAGWSCQRPGEYRSLLPGQPRFSWFRPSVLWRSRNEVLASMLGDPTGRVRHRWVEGRRAKGWDPLRPIDRTGLSDFSFLVLGDTGEGDASQYAVIPGMLRAGEGTAFALIASDVVYPGGSVNDYPPRFYEPYKGYPAPIFAVPGNHDWYDGLGGFMRAFCDVPPGEQPDGLRPPGLAGLIWRRPDRPDEDAYREARKLRPWPAEQAGPYWCMDTGPLRIVGIDTGMTGDIDAEQGRWLREVSTGDPRPKLLITGEPIYADNKYHPGRIRGGGTVDQIVRDPASGYVAVIGGDTHNYQRYPVRVGDRVIQYIVAGGSGAFTHATHTIGRVGVGGVAEEDFRCYPLRGDSLSMFSKLYSERLRLPWLYVEPNEAVALMSERIGIPAPRASEPVKISTRARWVARLMGGYPWPFRFPVGAYFQRYISELSDWDHPPFFKSFLRLDVDDGVLRIRCFAATGCAEHEENPPLEDEVTIPLGRTGNGG